MSKRRFKRVLWRGFMLLLVSAFLASGALRLWGGGRAFATDGPLPLPISEEAQMPLPEINALIEVLNEREALLEERAQELDQARADLLLARQEIEARLQDLVEAENRLAKRMAQSNEASATDLDKLTRVYEAMKPKVAAELFSTMDPNFAAEFLARMNPESAAALFSNLTPEAAYALSAVMAGRNALAATENPQ